VPDYQFVQGLFGGVRFYGLESYGRGNGIGGNYQTFQGIGYPFQVFAVVHATGSLRVTLVGSMLNRTGYQSHSVSVPERLMKSLQ
jgi:hypothetical protein